MKRETILAACALLLTSACAYQPYNPENEEEYLDTFCDPKKPGIMRISNDNEDIYPGEDVPAERMAHCHNKIKQ